MHVGDKIALVLIRFRMIFGITLAILLSILLDLVFGDPPTFLHPVGLQGWYIRRLWEARPSSMSSPGLFFYGLAVVTAGILLTLTAAGFIQLKLMLLVRKAGNILSVGVFVLASAVFLKGSFSFRNLLRAGRRVRAAIDSGNIPEARCQVSTHLVSRNVENFESAEIISAALESLAENFTDSLAAPLFWCALFGPAGAWVYRFSNTADAMLGYREGDREWGGKAAAHLDDILSWIPARIAGWTIIAAAVPSGLSPAGAARVMRRDSRNCSSPNSGWTMAAAAGAMNVRLEKPGSYVLNDEGRLPEAADLKTVNRLLVWSVILYLLPVTALTVSAAAVCLEYLPFYYG